MVGSKNFPERQEVQFVFAAPEHSPQLVWHASHLLLTVFSNSVVLVQERTHSFPSKYLDPVQAEHWLLLGPEHSLHSE